MPTIGVQHCLRDFSQTVQAAVSLAHDARGFRTLQPDGSYCYIGRHRCEIITGVGLFRIHLAWEEFLENVFVRYMCGAAAPSGYAPGLLGTPKASIAEGLKDLFAGQRYLNWTPPSTQKRALSYFDKGEPFATAISAVTHTLNDINAVRNGFAHRSDFAAQEFQRVVRNTYGYTPRGITPGRFLLMTNPSPSAGGQQFIDFYANTLLGASHGIVP